MAQRLILQGEPKIHILMISLQFSLYFAEKSKWLKIQRGNYNSYMSFNTDCINDLQSWLDNIDHTHKPFFSKRANCIATTGTLPLMED
jgi:hypothetical protein